jgi:hypothetical protein
VDFGSSHTFINSQLASQLQGVRELPTCLFVQVANGNKLQHTSHIPQATWSVDGYQFHSDLKVLPLCSYDMILGLDWLESLCPMKVDCKQKWLSIPFGDQSVLLFGENDALPAGTILQVCSVDILVNDSVEAVIPPAIQHLIDEFDVLFEVLTELSPSRTCDHSIPLVEGLPQ